MTIDTFKCPAIFSTPIPRPLIPAILPRFDLEPVKARIAALMGLPPVMPGRWVM